MTSGNTTSVLSRGLLAIAGVISVLSHGLFLDAAAMDIDNRDVGGRGNRNQSVGGNETRNRNVSGNPTRNQSVGGRAPN